MTDEEAREVIRVTLQQVAPEADLDEVGKGETFRESLDLDSIDFLNFVVGLHEATGVDIPERNYAEISTLEGCVHYLVSALPEAGAPSSGGTLH